MKHILLTISSLRLWWWAERVATTLWTELNQHSDYDLKYLTFYNVETKYDHLWEEICLHERLSSNIFINIYKLFRRAYQIKKHCREYDIDTSLSFMFEENFSNILSKLLFGNQAKIVISVRNAVNVQSKPYRRLIKLLYKYADMVTTIVEEQRQTLIQDYNVTKQQSKAIPNMIYSKKINHCKNESLWKYQHLFDQWIFTFINIGRLVYQKNQALLIDAFKSFYDQHPQSQLLILWEWDLRPDLESQIWDHPDIHLLWNQSNPYKFLKHADCFVFTSRYEWFGIVLIEAMQCWLPVISSDCATWPKEILWKHVKNFEPVTTTTQADYGVLVPIEDKSSLLQAMTMLYKDENLRNSYVQKSPTRAKDFELDTIIKQREVVLLSKASSSKK